MPDPLHLFQATGVELEYMIVDRATLDVRPIADRLIQAVTGDPEIEPVDGPIGWSNELALHVIELKTIDPAPSLAPLTTRFDHSIAEINRLLAPMGARLMPTAMHPWMDPGTELRLWPHGYRDVYETYDRIFSCKGHGWANLQSMHINLPFSGDEEFARLHAAIRFILPILPALAAGSPIVESRVTGLMDTRLEVYRANSCRIPSVAGSVVPEPVYSREAYHSQILEKIWADLAPHDPEGLLRYEWANARGCIARFDRSAIEIRVIDTQECPAADLAVCGAVVDVVKSLAGGVLADLPALCAWPVQPLHEIFLACVKSADQAVITDEAYLRTLGIDLGAGRRAPTAGEVWHALAERVVQRPTPPQLRTILDKGCLSRRILAALGTDVGAHAEVPRPRLAEVYGRLCDCLEHGRMFLP
jgi:carboxylate-amine ligase